MLRFARNARPMRQILAPAAVALAVAACGAPTGGAGLEPQDREVPLQGRLAPEDGAIVSVIEARVNRPWDALGESARARFDEDVWERARIELVGRADLVTYSSDGLRVGGFLVRPEIPDDRRVGAVIVNRDGIAGRGLDEDEILVELSRYAERGFVAAASAYRGNRLSQGVDELGGDDVNDVLSLALLLQRLDHVDPSRIFMVGFGRGGLMTLRALEMGAPVRAAAVVSGWTDVAELAGLDPELEAGFAGAGGWPGLAAIHGNWDGARDEQLARRNPGARAGALEVPLLVVHGRLDDEVPVTQALDVTTRLREAGTPVEALVYGYGDHALTQQRADWQARVMAWLERHDSRALFN